MDGWIKLSRKLLDWEWFNDDLMLRGWIYILLKANNTDTEWKGIELRRGQFVTSLKTMSEELQISVQQARRILANMQSSKQITSKTTNKFRIITVCKYDDYQYGKKPKQQANQQTNQQAKQQTNQQANQQQRKNKEDNNINIIGGDKRERMRVREEAMLETKVENACMAFFITRQEYVAMVDQILCDWAACDEEDWSYRHLYNTLRIKVSEKRRNNGTAKSIYDAGPDGRQQRAAAVAATIARLAAEDDARAAKVR